MAKASAKAATILALCLTAIGGALVRPSRAADAGRPTPSGLPVPRYVSLKFAQVNAHAGPDDDSRVLWTYHARGLPVQVVAETPDWRRICDPEGGVAWVRKGATDGRRTVMRTQAQAAPILADPRPDSHVKAYLQTRALAELERCDKGWCRIRIAGESGWTDAALIWGVDDALQCR